MLTKLFINKIKKKLLEEKENLLQLDYQKPSVDIEGDETDEIQGNILMELQKQLNIRNLEKFLQIESALKKIENHSYGICEDCDEDIPEKRLLVNPYFLTCVSCAEDREIENKQRKR